MLPSCRCQLNELTYLTLRELVNTPSSQEAPSTEAADLKGLILLFRVSKSLHRVRQGDGDVLHKYDGQVNNSFGIKVLSHDSWDNVDDKTDDWIQERVGKGDGRSDRGDVYSIG